MDKQILNIGHRGARDLALENSLGSISKALALNVDAIEIDLRSTKDGKTVLMHDPTLNRTTQNKGYVENYDLQDLQNLKLKNEEKIPSLEDCLDLIGNKSEVLLDVKDAKSLDHIIKVIKERKLESTYLFSDNPKILIRLKKDLPTLRYGVLFHALMPYHPQHQRLTSLFIKTPRTMYNFFKYLKEIDPTFLNVGSFMINKLFVQYWKEKKGIQLFVWGKNSTEEKMRSLISYKIDAIVTDRPDILKDLLNQDLST